MGAKEEAIEATVNDILEAFRSGRLVKPLAQSFLIDNRHRSRWSPMNQAMVALAGAEDAATYQQWLELGRQVRKGTKAHYIRKPVIVPLGEREAGQDEEQARIMVNVKWFAVFGIEDTDPIPGFDGQVYELPPLPYDRIAFIQGLPLIDVARAWGIDVTTYSGVSQKSAVRVGTLGATTGARIALGVKNWSTWAHELVHVADMRLGTFHHSRAVKPPPDNEIVAELGGAILLVVMGHDAEADWGGAYEYLRNQANGATGESLVRAIDKVLGRALNCVRSILEAAEGIAGEASAQYTMPAGLIGERAMVAT